MKILYDDPVFNMPFGGVSRYFYELIRNLPDGCVADLSAKTVQCRYFQEQPFNFPEAKKTFWNFLPWLRIRGKSYLYRMLAGGPIPLCGSSEYENKRIFVKKLQAGDYDVVHLTNPHEYTFEWIEYARKKPVVLTIHDLIPDLRSEATRLRARRAKALRYATRIIAVSQNTKNDIVRLYGTPDDKITVVYHGHSSEEDAVDVEVFPGMKYILFVGQRGGYKNFCFFARALAPWMKQHKDFHLVCSGSELTDAEKRPFVDAGVDERVHARFIDQKHMNSLYRYAFAFVYPSRYEGFGIPILDAFNEGCPVILSRCSCFPEVGGGAALYFDDSDSKQFLQCLDRLESCKDVRDQLVGAGRRRVAEFTWKRCATETACVYNRAYEEFIRL